MAMADYMLCANCEGKAFYDAEVNYDYFDGQATALCSECAKTLELVVVPRITKLDDLSRFEAAFKMGVQK